MVVRPRGAPLPCGALAGVAAVALAAGTTANTGRRRGDAVGLPLASGVTTPAAASVALPMGTSATWRTPSGSCPPALLGHPVDVAHATGSGRNGGITVAVSPPER